MELSHAAYFYTLAQIGIAFAGFATILMALRESRGRPMTKFDLWVAKSYIQSGLVTAICAMLPALLFSFGLSETRTWQVASLLIGVPSLAMLLLAPAEWRARTDMPVRPRLWAQIGVGLIVNIALLFNAAGWPWQADGSFIMLAVSWNLFGFFAQFAESVNFFFENEER
jgi:hypothetical protein